MLLDSREDKRNWGIPLPLAAAPIEVISGVHLYGTPPLLLLPLRLGINVGECASSVLLKPFPAVAAWAVALEARMGLLVTTRLLLLLLLVLRVRCRRATAAAVESLGIRSMAEIPGSDGGLSPAAGHADAGGDMDDDVVTTGEQDDGAVENGDELTDISSGERIRCWWLFCV